MRNDAKKVPNIKVRAPLKWAGGKYQILDRILPRLPEGERLIEPFVGSGAIFLNSTDKYKKLLINDLNSDLITFYKTLKKYKEDFINEAEKLFTHKNNRKEVFYELRNEFNKCTDPFRKSVIFLYINKHGFNGLCRYNNQGFINVPFGRHEKPYFPRKELCFFAKIAHKLKIEKKDFESIFRFSKKGDVIYCDPPYSPLTRTANFTSYNANGFSAEDHHRLTKCAINAAKRGVPVIISNSKTEFTLDIYAEAELHEISVRRYISCNGKKRGMASELIAVYK